MNASILLAVVSACMNTVNDLLYRRTASREGDKEIYVFYFLASFFSALTAAVLGLTVNGRLSFEQTDIFFGILLGALSFVAYILFLFSFNGSNTTVTVTVYRLNMIPGIILAVAFLGEVITLRRGTAILLCVVSILLLAGRSSAARTKTRHLVIILGACLAGGILNMLNKVAVIHGALPLSLLFWRFLTVAILSGMVLYFKRPVAVKLDKPFHPLLSGILMVASIFCILKALETGDVSVVIPIAQMAFVLVAVISWVLLNEKVSVRKIAGIICAVLALISIT